MRNSTQHIWSYRALFLALCASVICIKMMPLSLDNTGVPGPDLLLPLTLALPFDQAVPDTSYLNAWFEMLSAFTTTGLTLYDAPERLVPSLHLWRGLVGWLGGFFILLLAAAILLAGSEPGPISACHPHDAWQKGPADRRWH